mgnify:CR=1 FL=1
MTTESPIRICMVDDHLVVRDGMRTLLELSGMVNVVCTAVSAEEALEVVACCACDLVLMDQELPVHDGIWCTREIKRRWPEMKVLMLTMHADEQLVADAVEAGADGYLLKSASRDEVLRALRDVHEGRTYVDPRVAGSLVARLRRGPVETTRLPPPPLSPRELEILSLAAGGNNNKDIADKLGLAQNTVKTHLRSIYRKCGVPDRLQAVLFAMRNGLV